VTPQDASTQWFDATDPLGSAVNHVRALSPRLNWVGIYVLRDQVLELGPSIGRRRRIRGLRLAMVCMANSKIREHSLPVSRS
jgi:putative methionine-R-sulfoxide reductase with GAF domain